MTEAEIRALRERVEEAKRNNMAKKTKPMPKPKSGKGKGKGC